MRSHAFGERFDAPLPLWLYVIGGGLVVLISFAAISWWPTTLTARAARQGRTQARRPGAEVTGAPGSAVSDRHRDITPQLTSRSGSLTSVSVLLVLVLAGLFGRQEVAKNLLPTTFWVLAWVGLPLAVGLLGDFTGAGNPWAALARWADHPVVRARILRRRDPLPWPPGLGFWPAVAGYVVVVLGELVVNSVAVLPRVTAIALIVYSIYVATGALVFGAPVLLTRGEVFTVSLATWGRLGYWRGRAGGTRGFGGGLAVPLVPSPSRIAMVLVLLASVTYDGVLSTPQWSTLAASLPLPLGPGTASFALISTCVGTAVVGALWGFFQIFARATARAGRWDLTPRAALCRLLPSVMPISYGYLLAHYLQYVAINGQLFIALIGDPLGQGWRLLPYPFNGSFEPNTAILPNSIVWYVQVLAIVGAHVIAVAIAHTAAARTSPDAGAARAAEWPWLVAMIGYTMLSLWLLAQPVLR